MRMHFGLLLFCSQHLIIFTGCCIPSPCPYFCNHSCGAAVLLHLALPLQTQLCGWWPFRVCVCVLASELFPPSPAWPLFEKERKKTWGDLESGRPCLMLPALEEPLLLCPASCWSGWAPTVLLGGRKHRSGSISACCPTVGSFLRQHW